MFNWYMVVPSNNSCNEVPLDFRPRWVWNQQISNDDRTEWSPIQSVIVRVINKIVIGLSNCPITW